MMAPPMNAPPTERPRRYPKFSLSLSGGEVSRIADWHIGCMHDVTPSCGEETVCVLAAGVFHASTGGETQPGDLRCMQTSARPAYKRGMFAVFDA